MKIGVTEIRPRSVQQVAEKKFKEGYYCCEALVSAIRDEFKLDIPEEVIAMASGMAVGAGNPVVSVEHLTEGFLHLDYFLDEPNRTDQRILKV